MRRVCWFLALLSAVMVGQSLQVRMWPLVIVGIVSAAVFLMLAEGEAR